MSWPAPIPLTVRISLVGSGLLGLSLTDPHDCHVYLLDGGSDAVVIDAGCGLASAQIAANVQTVLGGRSVSRVLLTHAHPDHAGGAATLGRQLGAEVIAQRETASIVATGDEDSSGLCRARQAGTYPSHLRPDTHLGRDQLPPRLLP